MTDVQQHFDSIRQAANAGDPGAAREFGRLLGLLPAEIEEPGDEWPCVRWFRTALEAHPEDHEAGVLLAARLSHDADAIAHAYGLGDYADDEEVEDDEDDSDEGDLEEDDEATEAEGERTRMRAEARRIYEDVLRAAPGNRAARSGLAALEDAPFVVTPYSHYVVEGEYWSGTVGRRERLVVTDADELRWACQDWFADVAGLGAYHLSVYTSGERQGRTSLEPMVPAADGSLDWSVIAVPPLPGEPLPHGHPALLDGHVAHYGWHTLDLG